MFNKIKKILKNNRNFSVAKLDGFLTSIISSPNLIHPLDWIKITKIKDPDLDLIFEFYNQIYFNLRNNMYVPIFIKSDPEKYSIYFKKWANGYIVGKNLWDPRILKIHQIKINELLLEIIELSENKIIINQQFITLLSEKCIEVYNFWSKQAMLNSVNST